MYKKIIFIFSIVSIILLSWCNSQPDIYQLDSLELPNGNIQNRWYTYSWELNGNRTVVNSKWEIIEWWRYKNDKRDGERIETTYDFLWWNLQWVYKDGKREWERKVIFDPDYVWLSDISRPEIYEEYIVWEMFQNKPVWTRIVHYSNWKTEELEWDEILFYFWQ